MSPSIGVEGKARGYIVAVGGAEKHSTQAIILQKFAELTNSNGGQIVVIPTASETEEAGPRYVSIFSKLGVSKEVLSIPIKTRSDSEKPDYIEKLKCASAIFITGGNQLRLSTVMGGTSVARLIRKLNAEGVHVAGTSAGAAILSEHMIAGGASGATPTPDGVTLAPGLGLTNSLIIDQHFRQRDRLGRLLAALSYNPFMSGIGLDEDTAVFINPKGVLEVVGSGAVTIVDPSKLKYSSMGSVSAGQPVSLIGLRLHILASGGRYDTHSRKAIIDDKDDKQITSK